MADRLDLHIAGELGGPVLAVGGAGFVGSHTVRLLQQHGIPVVVFDNLSSGHRRLVSAPLEVGNLADREALRRVFEVHRPAAVLHFAAKCYVGESVDHPAMYYRENVVHTWNLLEAMRHADCRRIVFSSSCAVYGIPQRLPIDESHQKEPISPYGRTKLHMEHMMEDFAHAYGLSFVALRYFNAAGASQDASIGELHDPETHLIPIALQVALGQRPKIMVFGDDYETPDGTCIRDYIHVEDLATAHLQALASLVAPAQRTAAFNLGVGAGFSVLEVIEAARRVTGHPIPAEITARRAGDPPVLICAADQAREHLGWRPERPGLEDMVRDAWRFLRQQA